MFDISATMLDRPMISTEHTTVPETHDFGLRPTLEGSFKVTMSVANNTAKAGHLSY